MDWNRKWVVFQVIESNEHVLIIGIGEQKQEWYYPKQTKNVIHRWVGRLNFYTQGNFIPVE